MQRIITSSARWGQCLQFFTLFSIAVFLQEMGSAYQRYLNIGWILVCLWVLVDASQVCCELKLVQSQLQESQKKEEVLQKQNMELCASIYHCTENHRLLCEIRNRIMEHNTRTQRNFNELSQGGVSWEELRMMDALVLEVPTSNK